MVARDEVDAAARSNGDAKWEWWVGAALGGSSAPPPPRSRLCKHANVTPSHMTRPSPATLVAGRHFPFTSVEIIMFRGGRRSMLHLTEASKTDG